MSAPIVKSPCSKTSENLYRDASQKTPPWVATPFSSRPYYPMALGNGSDCVTIGYMGSMCAPAGHSGQQHQALVTGWYKTVHRVYHIPPRVARATFFPSHSGFAQPCIQAGYTVMVDGEIVEASDFAQSFDARRAILTTDVNLHGGRWRVTTYLNDEHVWVESFEALHLPRGKTVDLILFIRPFTSSFLLGVELVRHSVLNTKPLAKEGALAFDYKLAPNEFRGQGIMWGMPRGVVKGNEIIYSNVKTGFVAAHCLMLVDDVEALPAPGGMQGCCRRLKSSSETQIRRAHANVWLNYFKKSRIAVPDSASQGLYDLSMYWMRANQHPENGSLNLGPFPCHWGGGANAVWDAGVMQVSLLVGNHVAESRKLLDYYRMRMPRARFVAKTLGCPGARLCFFAAADGQDAHADPEKIRTEKITTNATACLSFYDHWRIAGRDDSLAADLGIMRELLDHALAVVVMEKTDRAYIVDAFGLSEGRCKYSNDSFLAISTARALRGYCEMAEAAGMPVPERYLDVAFKLAKGLRENYRNGVLMDDKKGAQGGGNPMLALSNLPDALKNDYTPKSLEYWMRITRTQWGYDSSPGTFRDWPWVHCWLSIIFSHWGWDRKAFAELQLSMKDCSSLGAIPEYIRLDGFAGQFWYTASHAYYLWALQNALCHDRPDNALGLLQGMDGTWKDLTFRQLRMQGGLLVSLKATKGRVRELVLHNDGVRPVQRKLIWNPRYAGMAATNVSLRPGQTIKVK